MHQQVTAEDALKMALLLYAEHESLEQIIEEEQAYRVQVAALSQMQLQAMERVEVQERELRRLSALLVEHQAILRSLPERLHQESPQASPPRNLGQLRCEVEDLLPSTVNTVRGAAERTGHVPDLGRLPTVERDTFEDILADVEDEIPITPQRQVQFADVASSTPVLRPTEYLELRTQPSRASLVPSIRQGLFEHLEPWKDLFEEGFSHSLWMAATEFRKLREPNVAKLNEGYSSDASLVYQSWLKDIQVYFMEHHLSQW